MKFHNWLNIVDYSELISVCVDPTLEMQGSPEGGSVQKVTILIRELLLYTFMMTVAYISN